MTDVSMFHFGAMVVQYGGNLTNLSSKFALNFLSSVLVSGLGNLYVRALVNLV